MNLLISRSIRILSNLPHVSTVSKVYLLNIIRIQPISQSISGSVHLVRCLGMDREFLHTCDRHCVVFSQNSGDKNRTFSVIRY